MSVSTGKPRSPAEIWKSLEKQAAADEMDRILALDDRQLECELKSLSPSSPRGTVRRSVARRAAAGVAAGCASRLPVCSLLAPRRSLTR